MIGPRITFLTHQLNDRDVSLKPQKKLWSSCNSYFPLLTGTVVHFEKSPKQL